MKKHCSCRAVCLHKRSAMNWYFDLSETVHNIYFFRKDASREMGAPWWEPRGARSSRVVSGKKAEWRRLKHSPQGQVVPAKSRGHESSVTVHNKKHENSEK